MTEINYDGLDREKKNDKEKKQCTNLNLRPSKFKKRRRVQVILSWLRKYSSVPL